MRGWPLVACVAVLVGCADAAPFDDRTAGSEAFEIREYSHDVLVRLAACADLTGGCTRFEEGGMLRFRTVGADGADVSVDVEASWNATHPAAAELVIRVLASEAQIEKDVQGGSPLSANVMIPSGTPFAIHVRPATEPGVVAEQEVHVVVRGQVLIMDG